MVEFEKLHFELQPLEIFLLKSFAKLLAQLRLVPFSLAYLKERLPQSFFGRHAGNSEVGRIGPPDAQLSVKQHEGMSDHVDTCIGAVARLFDLLQAALELVDLD